MYSRELFSSGSKYFEALRANPSDYIHKCDEKTVNWLKNIKEKKKAFLITGSHIDYASFTASYAIVSFN
jgi:hypothetical protein